MIISFLNLCSALACNFEDGNNSYETKYGFIFIVCATGKSAEEMLSLLQERIKNDRSDELKIAITEQNKITHLRLNKLME